MTVRTATDAFTPADRQEMLILVDEHNRRIGLGEKLDVHLKGQLHRAFSIFLADDEGRVLLQRRDAGKYHSGGLWANTCCGHPRFDEKTLPAANRRLGEELGMSASLHYAFQARYETRLDRGLTENELVYVYVGRIAGEPDPNPVEVSETRLVTLQELVKDAARHPESYAYWLRHYLGRHRDQLAAAIAALPPTAPSAA
ncbi:MAG: isopentenyl-diphosphate Delta-isomerase [Beijerinckiaceae bacterium]